MTAKRKYKVLRDTREQKKGDGWWWDESELCSGTEVRTFKTGDYSLEGFEESFVIERKADTGEIAQNINEGRFERELERMEAFEHPFLIASCDWDDVYAFPERSGIPRAIWPQLRVTAQYMAKRLCEFELRYKTRIILAGPHAKRVASSLFKRLIEEHERRSN